MCWEPLPSIPRVPDLRAFYAALGDADDSARLNGNQQAVVSEACLRTRSVGCLGCGLPQSECSPSCGARMAGGWER